MVNEYLAECTKTQNVDSLTKSAIGNEVRFYFKKYEKVICMPVTVVERLRSLNAAHAAIKTGQQVSDESTENAQRFNKQLIVNRMMDIRKDAEDSDQGGIKGKSMKLQMK